MLWSVIAILLIPRIVCEDDTNGGRRAQKNEVEENNGFFSVKVIEDQDLINSLWIDMDSVEKLSFRRGSHAPYPEYFRQKDSDQKWHLVQIVKLPFNISFNGYTTDEVSVSEDGHICVEKRKRSTEPCTNYVAPLLRKLFFRENSYLKCVANETTFSVQWGNVDLSASTFYEYGRNISLQVTLNKTGSFVFVYKQILSMRTHENLPPNFAKLQIGIADSFPISNHFYPARKMMSVT
ncbi:Hypothetical predicted protein [Cloeon dipterum]|uniref:Laminin G domain-containing protein n=1 Tax=Cloeon dipterum TaxID=197152 RepID=A0A8S1CY20_9INSE|nr:Hypothetical predicted protein [Cloeon dipterum]